MTWDLYPPLGSPPPEYSYWDAWGIISVWILSGDREYCGIPRIYPCCTLSDTWRTRDR
jgi:hypothetical protein